MSKFVTDLLARCQPMPAPPLDKGQEAVFLMRKQAHMTDEQWCTVRHQYSNLSDILFARVLTNCAYRHVSNTLRDIVLRPARQPDGSYDGQYMAQALALVMEAFDPEKFDG